MKKTKVKCVCCGKKFLKWDCRIKRANTKNYFCSRKCYVKWSQISENTPNYLTGKSILHLCECGTKIAFKSKQCRICYANRRRTGRTLPNCIDCGKKLSAKHVKRCCSCSKKGERNVNYGKINQKGGWRGIRFYYKNTCLRSSYELNFAYWLDLNNIKWEYEYKMFKLGPTTYTPDFYLSEFDTYIEIKGWQSPIFKQKLKRFKKEYKDIKYQILTGKELNKMSIINIYGRKN